MMKDILDGVKEVVLEIGTGMMESCKTLSSKSSEFFEDVNVKIMGSYEEIDAYEKEKEAEKSA